MKVLKIILVLFVLSSFFSCTINKPVEKTRYFTVNGSSSVFVEPNVAEITFTVVTSGWSAKQIIADSDTIATRFINAVIAVGVSEGDISKSPCTVSTVGNSYESKRQIKIILRNISLLGAVIDCKTPAIRLNPIVYSYNDSASEIRQARTGAVQNAQDAASLYAGAIGSKIANVSLISDEKIQKTFDDSGKIKITCDLTVTYELQ